MEKREGEIGANYFGIGKDLSWVRLGFFDNLHGVSHGHSEVRASQVALFNLHEGFPVNILLPCALLLRSKRKGRGT